MKTSEKSAARRYFPAILCVECDSPIDALVSLCVPRDEATDLVAASWRSEESWCVMASVDGGRSVAALRTEEGRWAACNAFLEPCYATRREAEQQLLKLLKRGRRGYVGADLWCLAGAAGTETPTLLGLNLPVAKSFSR